jgi:sulfonate transport system ATP-binding protein
MGRGGERVIDEQSDESTIVLRNVGFAYGANRVLEKVDFHVAQHEFVVVVGRSGSGKSTLLKSIGGLVSPRGTVQVKGRTRTVFQEDRLFPWYTALGNVKAGASGAPRKEAHALLDEMGLRDLARRYPRDLSGGERQRVAIARAFASDPDVVLMDEPFGAVDVLTRERLQKWLLDFWTRKHAAVVFVTHDVEEALMLGDRVAVLANGRLDHAMHVPFRRPRDDALRYTMEFLDCRLSLRDALLDGEAESAAVGSPAKVAAPEAEDHLGAPLNKDEG